METRGDIVTQVITNHPMNPDTNSKSDYQRRISILRDFALNTTTHGVAGIARSRSLANRIFWAVSCTLFTGVMLYFIILAICAYFEYPTQTRISVNSQRIQYFPAFTICNACGIRADTVDILYDNYIGSLNITNTSDDSLKPNQADFIRLFFPKLMNAGESIDKYVFPLMSMLVDCKYAGTKCSYEDFIAFDSSAYGRCYTFNAKTKNGTLLYNYETDSAGKLSLRLYIHAHQYVPFAVEGRAMVAMVHDNTQLPYIEKAGMALAPGFQYWLPYRKRELQFMPPPYSSCTNDIPLAMKIMFEKYEGAEYVYSEELCHMLCSQAYIYDQCGCVSPAEWNARSIVLPGSDQVIIAPLCNITDHCYIDAMKIFDLTRSIQKSYCSHCLEQCTVREFIVKPSLLKAPPDWLFAQIKTFVENSTISLPGDWSTRWEEHIRSSYLSLELYSESSLVETYVQTPALKPVDIISNVGGQTSLWIGISFLTIMEFIEMLYRLIQHEVDAARKIAAENQREIKTEQ